jgi:hypothetical protein
MWDKKYALGDCQWIIVKGSYYSGNKIPQPGHSRDACPRESGERESTKDWIPYPVLNDMVDMFICRSNKNYS